MLANGTEPWVANAGEVLSTHGKVAGHAEVVLVAGGAGQARWVGCIVASTHAAPASSRQSTMVASITTTLLLSGYI